MVDLSIVMLVITRPGNSLCGPPPGRAVHGCTKAHPSPPAEAAGSHGSFHAAAPMPATHEAVREGPNQVVERLPGWPGSHPWP